LVTARAATSRPCASPAEGQSIRKLRRKFYGLPQNPDGAHLPVTIRAQGKETAVSAIWSEFAHEGVAQRKHP
jgi:hypothetical protein